MGCCGAVETERCLGNHPGTGQEISVLQGPYGWYLEMSPPPAKPEEDASGNGASKAGKKKGRAKAPKPQRVSLGKLLPGQAPEVTLEEAVELLQWPKVWPLLRASNVNTSCLNCLLCGPLQRRTNSLPAQVSLTQWTEATVPVRARLAQAQGCSEHRSVATCKSCFGVCCGNESLFWL